MIGRFLLYVSKPFDSSSFPDRWGRLLLLCVGSTFALGQTKVLAEGFPYSAEVSTDRAEVRSGPGRHYYPTDKLQRETSVDVYRHDGDWAAIRPPEGSYSWVKSTDIKQLRDDVGQITRSRATSRVGSLLSTARDVVHVRLKKEELVTLLGKSVVDGQTWYKISPPAGEFRWVRLSDVNAVNTKKNEIKVLPKPEEKPEPVPVVAEPKLEPPVVVSPPVSVEPELKTELKIAESTEVEVEPLAKTETPVAVETQWKAASQPEPTELPIVETESYQPQPLQLVDHSNRYESNTESKAVQEPSVTIPSTGTGWRKRSSRQLRRVVRSERSRVAIPVGSAGGTFTHHPTAKALPSTNQTGASLPTKRFFPQGNASFDQQLHLLELELSHRVSRSAEGGRFDDLRIVAEQLVSQANTIVQRRAARSTFEKIEKFNSLQQRQANLSAVATTQRLTVNTNVPAATNQAPAWTNPPVTTAQEVREIATPAVGAVASKYDAVGTLQPVVSKRTNAPRYALVDEKGKVFSFVTPAPDVNLQPYLGQRVGITGQRGFWQEFKTSHVTASRIAPVNAAVRR